MAVTINIERLYISPEGTQTVLEGLDRAVSPEAPAGPEAPTIATAEGAVQPESPTAEPGEAETDVPTGQASQEDIDATARRNFLRNTVMHADRARRLEGFQTNHQRRPNRLKQASKAQHRESTMAQESLERACAVCALRSTCTITDYDNWLDFHPYKDAPKGSRRPGSLLLPGQPESRKALLRALAKDPLAHCDPSKRLAPPEK